MYQTVKDDIFISKSLKEIWELAQLVKQGSGSDAQNPGCAETLVIPVLGRWRQEAASLAELIRVPGLNRMGGEGGWGKVPQLRLSSEDPSLVPSPDHNH